MERNDKEVVDLRKIVWRVAARKKLFAVSLGIAFVVSSALILCVPRYYRSTVKLAPEFESAGGMSAISSLASSFGLDLGSMPTQDAISPLLYPELLQSNEFVVSLLDIQVESEDGAVRTDYATYMKKHQKETLYKIPFKWVERKVKSLLSRPERPGRGGADGRIDPRRMTEAEEMLVEGIKSGIVCSVDKQTLVVSITVDDQDPLVCATMADSVRARLQKFITDYRTSKARIDLEYYEQLTAESQREYERAVETYSQYCDAHRNTILQAYISRRDELENDLQLKFNTYTAMNTQLQAAKAKVQERTPAFTVLQAASAPTKPAGPKRMLFVLGMMVLTALGTMAYIFKDDYLRPFKKEVE